MTLAMRLTVYLGIAWYDQTGIITSAQLEQKTGINATQIRRDLSELLGVTGKRGVGYRCSVLIDKLEPFVRRDRDAVNIELYRTSTNLSHARYAHKALTGYIERKGK